MFCTNCGKEMNAESAFCTECGARNQNVASCSVSPVSARKHNLLPPIGGALSVNGGVMKFFANAPVFAIVYILFMLPTYYLPYVGSNSSALNALGAAAGAGLNPAFYWHLIALLVLIVAAWFRGTFIGKKWLVIFPILATVFDLTPGLSAIPLVPTAMHLLAIILGVVGVSAVATPQSGPASNA